MKGISVKAADFLKDPIVRRYLGEFCNKDVIVHQLKDPLLREVSCDEIKRDGVEDYLKKILQRGNEWEKIRQEKQEEQRLLKTILKASEDDQDHRIELIEDPDSMEMKLILHKPEPWEKPLTENTIWKTLLQKGVSYGVKEEFILRLIERPIYEKRIKIAVGKKAEAGQDGKAVFHFNTDFKPAPKIGQNGIADYKSLDYVQNVKKGDLLCEIIPPTRGKEGKGLDGKVLPGIMGNAVDITAGNNTVYSDDKSKIYAACEGCPVLRDGEIMVCKVLILDQVDASTGNIDFYGSIQITGDVVHGFYVHATEDIIVEGIVEGSLYAGGNIILKSGMKGSETSELKASGNVVAEFIENAAVTVKKSLYTDALLNSNVECWEKIDVFGGRGKLIGGHYNAGEQIIALEIGNHSNTLTVLKIISTIGRKEKIEECMKKLSENDQMIHQIVHKLETEKVSEDISRQIAVIRMSYVVMCLRQEKENLEQRLDFLREGRNGNHLVWAREVMYSNVFIEIDGVFYRNDIEREKGVIMKTVNGRMEQLASSSLNAKG